MPRPKPIRVYLRTNRTEYRRLAWFQNNRTNEILFGLYGFTGESPILRYTWPERKLLPGEIFSAVGKFCEPTKADLMVDHIICRADGTLQILTKDHNHTILHENKRTEAHGEKTSVFLEFVLKTDFVEKYAIIDDRPKHPSVKVDVVSGKRVEFCGIFSGVDCVVDSMLEAMIPNATRHGERLELNSKTLKGTLIARMSLDSHDTQNEERSGTMLSVKFPSQEKGWCVKSFLFE